MSQIRLWVLQFSQALHVIKMFFVPCHVTFKSCVQTVKKVCANVLMGSVAICPFWSKSKVCSFITIIILLSQPSSFLCNYFLWKLFTLLLNVNTCALCVSIWFVTCVIKNQPIIEFSLRICDMMHEFIWGRPSSFFFLNLFLRRLVSIPV
jgi:hypothetical protein